MTQPTSRCTEQNPEGPAEDLVERVGVELRRLGAQRALTNQVIAERFGLHTTDVECLDLIYMRGRTSPGELARATGLTSGSITTLIDRLERAGYVVREGDQADRRRRHIRLRPEAIAGIAAIYEPMKTEMLEVWSSFHLSELKVIVEFLSRSTDVSVACVERIRTAMRPATVKTALPPNAAPEGATL